MTEVAGVLAARDVSGHHARQRAGVELAVDIPAASHVLAELIAHRADCFPLLPSIAEAGTAACTAISASCEVRDADLVFHRPRSLSLG